MRGFGFFLLSLMSIGVASASSCGSVDDPMSWDEGFGVSRCRVTQERYHIHDYDSDGMGRAGPGDEDPMSWPADQWRSDLFGGYSHDSDDRYDRRARPAPAHAAAAGAAPEAGEASPAPTLAVRPAPRRAKLITVGGDMKTRPGVLRFGGHSCRGVLVLTWGKLGSKQQCYSSNSRIRSLPSEGY